MVVRVVVKERTEGVGDEKVLPSPPPTPLELKAPPAVIVVSAFENPASELIVSGSVDTVGAADLFPIVGAGWQSPESGSDVLLGEREA